jgi:hypothetical protein
MDPPDGPATSPVARPGRACVGRDAGDALTAESHSERPDSHVQC